MAEGLTERLEQLEKSVRRAAETRLHARIVALIAMRVGAEVGGA